MRVRLRLRVARPRIVIWVPAERDRFENRRLRRASAKGKRAPRFRGGARIVRSLCVVSALSTLSSRCRARLVCVARSRDVRGQRDCKITEVAPQVEMLESMRLS